MGRFVCTICQKSRAALAKLTIEAARCLKIVFKIEVRFITETNNTTLLIDSFTTGPIIGLFDLPKMPSPPNGIRELHGTMCAI